MASCMGGGVGHEHGAGDCLRLRRGTTMTPNRIWAVALLTIALALSACGCDVGVTPTPTPVANNAPTVGAGAGGTAGTLNGVTLPPDAAPPDQQVFIIHYDSTADFTTIDFYESVYKH